MFSNDIVRKRCTSLTVEIFGYVLCCYGTFLIVLDAIQRSRLSIPPSRAYLHASSAIILIGLVSIVVGKALKNLEERLRRLEVANKSSVNNQ